VSWVGMGGGVTGWCAGPRGTISPHLGSFLWLSSAHHRPTPPPSTPRRPASTDRRPKGTSPFAPFRTAIVGPREGGCWVVWRAVLGVVGAYLSRQCPTFGATSTVVGPSGPSRPSTLRGAVLSGARVSNTAPIPLLGGHGERVW